jgi:Family of unknown function (DUF5343)
MAEQFAPYAPAKSVMLPISRYRERGLNWPLTAKSLEQIGVPDSMAPRTLQALRFLGLLDEDDQPTESFKRIRQASTEEYPSQLADVIRAAYLPVFSIVDPARDGDVAIADAFRRYEPGNQRDKMIALFRGLCIEAGIIQPKSRPRGTGRKPRADGQVRPMSAPPRPSPRPVRTSSNRTLPPSGTVKATTATAGSIYASSRRSFSSYRAGRAGQPPAATSGCRP